MTLRTPRLRLAAFAALLAVPLVIAACSSLTGSGDDDAADLRRARADWAALGARSYTFVVGLRCFCGVGDIRFTVVDGVATSRTIVDEGTPLPEPLFHDIETIDAMFAHLDRAIREHAFSLQARYDQHGVPVEVQIDYLQNAVDEEFGWVVKSITLTP
jgi:hypothetical protein